LFLCCFFFFDTLRSSVAVLTSNIILMFLKKGSMKRTRTLRQDWIFYHYSLLPYGSLFHFISFLCFFFFLITMRGSGLLSTRNIINIFEDSMKIKQCAIVNSGLNFLSLFFTTLWNSFHFLRFSLLLLFPHYSVRLWFINKEYYFDVFEDRQYYKNEATIFQLRIEFYTCL